MKKIIIAISSILSIAVIVLLSLYFSPHVNSIFAKNYLAEKYNVTKSEIQYIDGRPPTIIWHNNGNIIGEPEWVDMSIEYKMNGKEFFVQRMNYKFYDDYQIYDIEELGTKWLQKNVDESIKGFSVDSATIYDFQLLSQSNHNMYFSFTNIDIFFKYYFVESDTRPIITIEDENDTKINKSLKDVFAIEEDINIYEGNESVNFHITNEKTGRWYIGVI